MPASQASMGYRTALEIALASAPATFTYIAEVKSNTPPSFSDSTIDVTHMQSPGGVREYISGLSDAGESSHEMNYVPGSATDVFLRSIIRKNLVVRLTFPNGRQLIYNAVRSGYETDIPTDDGMSATLTLKVSGEPILTPAAAPRNLIAPAISGVARVGIPLTVDDGVWAGASEVAYQWRRAAANIVGATGRGYVPVVADVGAVITCEVTGANEAFSTAVISAGTAAVVAA